MAEERDVGAIMVGTRGLSGIKSLPLGGVSSAIAHHALRPTVVAAPHGRG